MLCKKKVGILKTTELYTLKGLSLCELYLNFWVGKNKQLKVKNKWEIRV